MVCSCNVLIVQCAHYYMLLNVLAVLYVAQYDVAPICCSISCSNMLALYVAQYEINV